MGFAVAQPSELIGFKESLYSGSCVEAPAQRYWNESHFRSRRGDQPHPQTHQVGLARGPGLQEDMFEVGFGRRPGNTERGSGLGQRGPCVQAGEQAGFGRRQTKGGSHGVGTILRGWSRADEHRGNGTGTAAGCSRARKSLPVSGST